MTNYKSEKVSRTTPEPPEEPPKQPISIIQVIQDLKQTLSPGARPSKEKAHFSLILLPGRARC